MTFDYIHGSEENESRRCTFQKEQDYFYIINLSIEGSVHLSIGGGSGNSSGLL